MVFTTPEVSEAFKIRVLPTLYFIDRAGKILEAHTGTVSESSLRRAIERAVEAR